MYGLYTEQWCDEQLEEAGRILHYLQLRDQVIMRRVCQAQQLATHQAEATKQVLKDFRSLLGGAAMYQSFLLDCDPAASAAPRAPVTPTAPIAPGAPIVPGAPMASEAPEAPRASMSTLANSDIPEPTAEDQHELVPVQPRSSERIKQAESIHKFTSRKGRGPLDHQGVNGGRPKTRLHQVIRTPTSPDGRHVGMNRRQPVSDSVSTKATSAISPRRTTLNRNQPRALQQPPLNKAAKELSEARVKVLNRRKIVAERKRKQQQLPHIASQERSHPRSGMLNRSSTANLAANRSNDMRASGASYRIARGAINTNDNRTGYPSVGGNQTRTAYSTSVSRGIPGSQHIISSRNVRSPSQVPAVKRIPLTVANRPPQRSSAFILSNRGPYPSGSIPTEQRQKRQRRVTGST